MPPVQYIAKLLTHSLGKIEIHENYQKQSYRNRCIIYGANGPLPLVIPVKKTHGTKTRTKDIQLDYDTSWQKNHWRSITSAYNSSPFFEFYMDEFVPFYEKKEKFLIDFNTKLLHVILQNLEINTELSFTSSFNKTINEELDFRDKISPKPGKNIQDSHFIPRKYNQVFIGRRGFQENLSSIDLLFNEGPNSLQILKNSIRY